MWAKFKLRAPQAAAVLLLGLVIVAAAVRIDDYHLNRNVRNLSLKLVQVERLSQTTAVDYRVKFFERDFLIEAWDEETQSWESSFRGRYSRGVRCRTLGWEFRFSQGLFREYRFEGQQSRGPRYLVVEFYIEGNKSKRSLIFYREGDWRVLG